MDGRKPSLTTVRPDALMHLKLLAFAALTHIKSARPDTG